MLRCIWSIDSGVEIGEAIVGEVEPVKVRCFSRGGGQGGDGEGRRRGKRGQQGRRAARDGRTVRLVGSTAVFL